MDDHIAENAQKGMTALFVRRPVLAFVINTLIVVAGLAAFFGVEVRELPDVDRPVRRRGHCEGPPTDRSRRSPDPADDPNASRSPLMSRSRIAATLAASLLLASTGATTWLVFRVEALERTNASMWTSLEEVLGEMTRIRIEQSTELKGPEGLLEQLHTYAPMAADARVTDPDYRNAKKEIQAVLRAFESIGTDAWAPIMASHAVACA